MVDHQDRFESPRQDDQLISFAQDLAGVDELFVLSHDLRSLHSLTGTGQPITDVALLETLLSCQPGELHGDYFTPLLANRLPFLVGRTAERTTGSISESWAGLLLSHQRTLFEVVERRRRPTTMSVAAQLQWDQLPVRAARIGDFDIAATLEPASTVAGDMYDIAMNPAGVPTLLGMDAMGHGVSATLSAALALAAVRRCRRNGGSLTEQVCAADQAVLDEYDGARFVTMVAIELHADATIAVNAGHEPVRRGSATDGFRTLEIPADPPLGLLGATDYRATELAPLDMGETICLLSDGAAESRDAARNELGELGINGILGANMGASSLVSAHHIGRAVMDYCIDLDDDLTVVVATRNR